MEECRFCKRVGHDIKDCHKLHAKKEREAQLAPSNFPPLAAGGASVTAMPAVSYAAKAAANRSPALVQQLAHYDYEANVAIAEKKNREYQQRERRRQEKRQHQEAAAKVREETHVEQMKEKHGRYWFDVIEQTHEDCATAMKLREEDRAEQIFEYYKQQKEEREMDIQLEKEYEELQALIVYNKATMTPKEFAKFQQELQYQERLHEYAYECSAW